MSQKIDIEALKEGIKGLKRGSKLYITLKTELSKLGYWRNKARGRPGIGCFGDKDARLRATDTNRGNFNGKADTQGKG